MGIDWRLQANRAWQHISLHRERPEEIQFPRAQFGVSQQVAAKAEKTHNHRFPGAAMESDDSGEDGPGKDIMAKSVMVMSVGATPEKNCNGIYVRQYRA